jgi:Uma2 family endonuclease
MSTLQTAKISLAQYERMMEAGVFDDDQHYRVELIQGEITQMNAMGVPHANSVTFLNKWSNEVSANNVATVRIQQPILLPPSDSVPEPDVAWVHVKKYVRHPLPEDVLLLIEVADTTLRFDCGTKALLYAAAGIEDYWVVNLVDETVEVFREPTKLGYKRRTPYARGSFVTPLAYPQSVLQVNDVLDA